MEDWKIKIAALWIVLEFGFITLSTVEHYIPGYVAEHYAQATPEVIVVIAILMLIGPVMAFLSLTLKDSLNRWANIIVGIIFAGLALVIPTGYTAAYYAFAILVTIVEFVAAALIVWYAWKSKQKT
jgi:threonine/homoserine/homoserine lactone efflux protein